MFNDLLAVCRLKPFCYIVPSTDYDMKQHADNAQHAFSSDQAATLHLALPALEALHKAWTTRLSREKYSDFFPALQAGLRKIEEYYNRTAECDIYTFAMCCVPFLQVAFHTPAHNFTMFQCSTPPKRRSTFGSIGVLIS